MLLFLVDWASLLAFRKEHVGWYHYFGFVVVNVVLLGLTGVVWRWLSPLKSPPEKFPEP